LLNGKPADDRVKWWAPDRYLVSYMLDPRREDVYFMASTPEPDFAHESWSAPGDLGTLRAAYAEFHPRACALLDACPEVRKWALIERDPLPSWTAGGALLIGDACHPMLPYMAQGAASSMEDGVVLSRCFEEMGCGDVDAVFRLCEINRMDRTSRLQSGSRSDVWMRNNNNIDWVYGYDAWSAPLHAAAMNFAPAH
jgi:salicylate hydroxylase/6-hydroxynicotinate 3-monooxygenase